MYQRTYKSRERGKGRDDEVTSGSGKTHEHATDNEQQGDNDTSKGRNATTVHESDGVVEEQPQETEEKSGDKVRSPHVDRGEPGVGSASSEYLDTMPAWARGMMEQLVHATEAMKASNDALKASNVKIDRLEAEVQMLKSTRGMAIDTAKGKVAMPSLETKPEEENGEKTMVAKERVYYGTTTTTTGAEVKREFDRRIDSNMEKKLAENLTAKVISMTTANQLLFTAKINSDTPKPYPKGKTLKWITTTSSIPSDGNFYGFIEWFEHLQEYLTGAGMGMLMRTLYDEKGCLRGINSNVAWDSPSEYVRLCKEQLENYLQQEADKTLKLCYEYGMSPVNMQDLVQQVDKILYDHLKVSVDSGVFQKLHDKEKSGTADDSFIACQSGTVTIDQQLGMLMVQ